MKRLLTSSGDDEVSWFRDTPPLSGDYVVEGGGFEPPKSLTTDLQSVPFGRSGIPPGEEAFITIRGAGDGTRTRNLLITSQLLYQYELTGQSPILHNDIKTELIFLKKLILKVK